MTPAALRLAEYGFYRRKLGQRSIRCLQVEAFRSLVFGGSGEERGCVGRGRRRELRELW